MNTSLEVVQQVPVCRSPLGVEVSNLTNKAYIACAGSSSIEVFDIASNSTTTITLPYGAQPASISIDDTANLLFAASINTGEIFKIALADNSMQRYPSGRLPSDLYFSKLNQKLYIAARGSNSVQIMNPSNGMIETEIQAIGAPIKIVPFADDSYIGIISASTGGFVFINTTDYTLSEGIE